MTAPGEERTHVPGHVGPVPDDDAQRAALLMCSAPMLEALMRHARGVLDTTAFFVLDLHDAVGLTLARCIWKRVGVSDPMELAVSRPPTLIGAMSAESLADIVESAGDEYVAVASSLRDSLLPCNAHVLVAAAGGVDHGALSYRIAPMATCEDDPDAQPKNDGQSHASVAAGE